MPGLVLENGSGLSRNERVTRGRPRAHCWPPPIASAVREEFASSLAVAAIDGTVQRRFQNGTVAGQALLKTGTLEGVRAIAGYVIDAEGRRCIVVGDHQPSERRPRRSRARLSRAVGLPQRRGVGSGAPADDDAGGRARRVAYTPGSACCP